MGKIFNSVAGSLWIDAINTNPIGTLKSLLTHATIYPEFVDNLLLMIHESHPEFVKQFREAQLKNKLLFSTNSYKGPLFIEIPTDEIFHDHKLTNELNTYTLRIIHNLDKPGLTVWEFKDRDAALIVILKVQEKKYSFRFYGKDDVSFMQNKN